MVRLKPVGHTVSDVKYGDCKEIEKFVRKRQKQFKSVFFSYSDKHEKANNPTAVIKDSVSSAVSVFRAFYHYWCLQGLSVMKFKGWLRTSAMKN